MLASVFAVALATGASADGHRPDLSDLLTDILGYVHVRENVVILEGETMGSFVCKIDAADRAFVNYKETGDVGGAPVGYARIPVEEFEK